LKLIHSKDPQDTLGVAEKQGGQLRLTYATNSSITAHPENIVVAATGESAIGAGIAASWPGCSVPFEIIRDYDLPPYVSPKTLFVASGHTGDAEETRSALLQAEARGAQVVVIASGGALEDVAKEKNFSLVHIPETAQPCFAALANFKAILEVLRYANVLVTDPATELKKAATFLDASVAAWRPDVPTTRNRAKQIAQESIGKSVAIYSGPKLHSAAYKWKTDCNENAKHIAWVGQYPECSHNEFLGWSKQPVNKPYVVIDLRSNLEHERVQKSFIVSEQLLSGMRPSPIVIDVEGETLLEQLVWTIVLGDFVSLYLAVLNGLNPASGELVEKFKQAMGK
jgi:glucose/mannose-6-phosphate isomerase